MNSIDFNRWAFPLVAAAFIGLLVVLPIVQLRRRTGKWPIVLHGRAAPLQALIGWLFTSMMAAFCIWSGLYAWLGPQALGVWPVPQGVHWFGWGCIATGFVLGRVAQAQMGVSWRMGIDPHRTPLVTKGLFRLSRNPIYSSILLGLLGVVLVGPSLWTLFGWLATVLGLAVQVRFEERHMLDMHGEPFRSYASRVGRFLPRLGRLSRSR